MHLISPNRFFFCKTLTFFFLLCLPVCLQRTWCLLLHRWVAKEAGLTRKVAQYAADMNDLRTRMADAAMELEEAREQQLRSEQTITAMEQQVLWQICLSNVIAAKLLGMQTSGSLLRTMFCEVQCLGFLQSFPLTFHMFSLVSQISVQACQHLLVAGCGRCTFKRLIALT